ncbi:MAG TPA: hypothetical protein VFV25_05410, partial [Methylibium sp.]
RLPDRAAVEAHMIDYMERLTQQGVSWPHAARHIMGLWNGLAGARRWRQVWSDHRLKALAPREVSQRAQAQLQTAVELAYSTY